MIESASDHKVSSLDEGIVALDHAFCIMSCNQAASQHLGMELKPGDEFPLERIWSESSLKRIKSALRATLENGQVQQLHNVQGLDGSQTNFDNVCSIHPLFDQPDNIIGVILSIQPNELLGELRLSENPDSDETSLDSMLHKDLSESLPEGVFTINTNWRISSFNTRAEEITGFSRNEVMGRNCWEVFRSDLCKVGCPLRAALESGQTRMDQDVRILKKNGVRQTILVNAGVMRDHDGQIVGAVETFRPLIGEAISQTKIEDRFTFADIIGQSSLMQRIFEMLPDIAASDANVLISGESGTGKDLVARTIHEHSARNRKPFVAVNCSALAETLLESELFGHEKAAFTGATNHKAGRFEMAKGGTLFLDEIGELKPELQIKLLRVLENHEFERVGGTRTIPMEARIISATNRDLRKAIGEGRFREDFYYRLRTVPLKIPPLRERAEDIPLLVQAIIKRFNARYKKRVISVDSTVMKMFRQYHWPGNVRELERTLEHAYVFVKGPVILPQYLPAAEEFQPAKETHTANFGAADRHPDRETIKRILLQTNGNRKEAARLLGMSRTTLWRHLKKLDLDRNMFH